MRHGFTTGSCAAAAAKAASHMLLTGETLSEVSITTPKGPVYIAELEQIIRTENSVICGVRKDGGDDPDVTTGLIVLAEVSVDLCSGNDADKNADDRKSSDSEGTCDNKKRSDGKSERVFIDGGKGVGRVTMPGLDQPVGNAAINSVPREMIRREVESILEKTGRDFQSKTGYHRRPFGAGYQRSCGTDERPGSAGYDPCGAAAEESIGSSGGSDDSGQLRAGFYETDLWV